MRDGKQQNAARPEHPPDFGNALKWIGDVLQHLETQNAVHRLSAQRNVLDIAAQVNPDGLRVVVHQQQPAGMAFGKRAIGALAAAHVQGKSLQILWQAAFNNNPPMGINNRGEVFPRVRARAGQLALDLLPAPPNARIGCFLRHFSLLRV